MTTYTTKRSQSTQSLYANNVTNVFRNVTKVLILVKTKLPKIFKMNKTPKSTFFHVTSQTPTHIFPCIKVLLAFESCSMWNDLTYAHFWQPRKGQKELNEPSMMSL